RAMRLKTITRYLVTADPFEKGDHAKLIYHNDRANSRRSNHETHVTHRPRYVGPCRQRFSANPGSLDREGGPCSAAKHAGDSNSYQVEAGLHLRHAEKGHGPSGL